MLKKTLASLASLSLACSLAACGGSPDDDMTPSVSPPAPQFTTTIDTSVIPSSDTSEVPGSPDDSMSPSSEPVTSADSASPTELPSEVRGKWITVGEGEQARECTEEVENEGAIITIDATTISSFAFIFTLESLEESDADSVEGVFEYHDDSDELMTPRIRLETQDNWQTLEFIELDTEGQSPAIYARCS